MCTLRSDSSLTRRGVGSVFSGGFCRCCGLVTHSRLSLQEGNSFALVDAASAGTTVVSFVKAERRRPAQLETSRAQVGYHVTATWPRLKVRAYDTARLAVGAESVVEAFRRLLETRLARTKLKSSSVVLHLVQEFRNKILQVFSCDTGADFRLRIHGKDDGTKEWDRLERAIDSGCHIRDGTLTLSTCVAGDPSLTDSWVQTDAWPLERTLKIVFERSSMK